MSFKGGRLIFSCCFGSFFVFLLESVGKHVFVVPSDKPMLSHGRACASLVWALRLKMNDLAFAICLFLLFICFYLFLCLNFIISIIYLFVCFYYLFLFLFKLFFYYFLLFIYLFLYLVFIIYFIINFYWFLLLLCIYFFYYFLNYYWVSVYFYYLFFFGIGCCSRLIWTFHITDHIWHNNRKMIKVCINTFGWP